MLKLQYYLKRMDYQRRQYMNYFAFFITYTFFPLTVNLFFSLLNHLIYY